MEEEEEEEDEGTTRKGDTLRYLVIFGGLIAVLAAVAVLLF